MRTLAGLMLPLLAGMAALPARAAPTPTITQAVAATANRTPDNVELDAGRKPAEVLRFFGVRPGIQMLDLFGMNSYWAEIDTPVIGPKGRVTVWQPTQFYTAKSLENWQKAAGKLANVSLIVSPFEAPVWPDRRYDLALINLDYHDTYWQNAQRGIPRQEPGEWLKRLYAAIKPGGVVGVVDHVATAGSDPRQSVEALHRIDPAIIRADFERAGFKLEAESPVLRNPADDHSKLVFDKSIRGHTDRVVYKFRKPR